MSEIVAKLNDFFFDVEPDEPMDLPSMFMFYGVILLGIATTVTYLTLLFTGNFY